MSKAFFAKRNAYCLKNQMEKVALYLVHTSHRNISFKVTNVNTILQSSLYACAPEILHIMLVVKLKKPVTVEVFVLVCEALVLKNVEGSFFLITTLKVK